MKYFVDFFYFLVYFFLYGGDLYKKDFGGKFSGGIGIDFSWRLFVLCEWEEYCWSRLLKVS